MIQTKSIVHFTIPVRDLERSLEFYENVLGMTLIRKYSNMAFLRSGNDDRITILGVTDAIHEDHGNETLIHHAYAVDPEHYEEALQYARDNGYEVLREEDRVSPATIAGPRFYIHDPDKNVIEILNWSNPGEF
jgi:catechol 2,3-dioxygenase-like lactoylglutathione lyase family enzyme